MFKAFSISFVIFLVIIGCNKTEAPTPVITSLSISFGQVGAPLSIHGQRFSSVASENIVTFNGAPADVQSAAENQLDVTVPLGATTGKVMVTVKGQTTTGPVFTVYTPGILTSVSPICGPFNTEITIEGSGFEIIPANMQVIFNYSYLVQTSPTSYTGASDKIPLNITFLSATQIKAVVPSTIPAESSGELVVKAFGTEQLFVNGDKNAHLKFALEPFTITTFAPKTGKAGTLVVFTGSGFVNDPTMYHVFFMDGPSHITEATITNITSTQLTVQVPAGVVTGETSVFYDWKDGKSHGGAASPGVFTVIP